MAADDKHKDKSRRARTRRLFRRVRHRIRRVFAVPALKLAQLVVPPLYLGYMHFVWATSTVETNGFERLREITLEHDGAIALLWHEEVFSVAYAYGGGRFDFNAHTLASMGDGGEIITRILRRCGFTVFRGGTSTKASRRRSGVVADMVTHMRETRNVTYGITVDGSQGPAYRMKLGGIMIARECRRPLVVARTWYKRAIRLATWDRTAIPLPFNHIKYYLAGPYHVPEDANTSEGLYRLLFRLEDDLIDLAAQSYRDMGQPLPGNLVKRTPEERAAESAHAS